MFQNLAEFSYKRDWRQAIGFYIVWVIISFIVIEILAILLGSLIPTLSNSSAYGFGAKLGAFLSFIVSVGFAIVISKSKGLLVEFITIVLIIATAILAFFGIFLGLLIPAYLTTCENKKF